MKKFALKCIKSNPFKLDSIETVQKNIKQNKYIYTNLTIRRCWPTANFIHGIPLAVQIYYEWVSPRNRPFALNIFKLINRWLIVIYLSSLWSVTGFVRFLWNRWELFFDFDHIDKSIIKCWSIFRKTVARPTRTSKTICPKLGTSQFEQGDIERVNECRHFWDNLCKNSYFLIDQELPCNHKKWKTL